MMKQLFSSKTVQSLTFQLTAAILMTSLIGIGVVGVVVRQITISEFDRLHISQQEAFFVDRLLSYYVKNGSFEGIDSFLRAQDMPPPRQNPPMADPMANPATPNPTLPRPMPAPAPFVLLDNDGKALIRGGRFELGQQLDATLIAAAQPVMLNGQQIGLLLNFITSPTLDIREQEYIARANQALLYGIAVASFASVVIGVILARALTHPLRRLTQALHRFNVNKPLEILPVHTQNEIGQLVSAFNQMSAALIQSHQMRRQMTADIAHELRSPITVVAGYIEALRDGALPATTERFDTIYNETTQLQRLVDDLRMLSLADAGELPLQLEMLHGRELLGEALAKFEPLANKKGIRLIMESPAPLSPACMDRQRMLQVLGNLIGNAIRYTPPEGMITLRAYQHDQRLCLEVEDTGKGIPADKLPYIFQRFYRVENSRHALESQTGLGLAIAKSIVEAHNGTISAKSQVGQGTIIAIALPL